MEEKPGSHADIGDDNPKVLCRHHLSNDLLDRSDQLGLISSSCAGWSLEIDDELARIRAGEVGFSNKGIEAEAEDKEARNADYSGNRADQCRSKRALIAVEHPIKSSD